jgi:hypothetical protein
MAGFPYQTEIEFRQDFERAWKAGSSFNGTVSHVPWKSPFGIYQNIKKNPLQMMVMGNGEYTGESSKLNNFGVTADTPARSMWESLAKSNDWEEASRHVSTVTQNMAFTAQTDFTNRFRALVDAAKMENAARAEQTLAIDPSLKRYANAKAKQFEPAATLTSAETAALSEWESKFSGTAGGSWSDVSGAILWDQNWTPGVNDAWLLGAIHNRFEFHYTDNSMGGGVSGPGSKVGPRGQLWSDAGAGDGQLRVTGRELLGLNRFGYERAKVWGGNQDLQISFHLVNEEKWSEATFTNYNKYMTTLQSLGPQAVRRELESVSLRVFGFA